MMYQKYISMIMFLLFAEFSVGQNTVCFTIEDNPDINSIAYSDFTKYVRVLDCFNIYAESSIPDAKVLHAASIAAELLDNNEDGEVDDPLLKDELNANGALIPIFAYDGSPAMDNFLITIMVMELQLYYGEMKLIQIILAIGEQMQQ